LNSFNKNEEEELPPGVVRFQIRIGIHQGDILYLKGSSGDVLGDAVNIASRLEHEAAPGGVCVSERVYQDIGNHDDLFCVSMGPRTLKGV